MKEYNTTELSGHPDLIESLKDLHQCSERAKDEGWIEQTPEHISNAEKLLRRLPTVPSCEYWVYPTPEGEIVIDVGQNKSRLIITLFPEGNAIYTYSENNVIHAIEPVSYTHLTLPTIYSV